VNGEVPERLPRLACAYCLEVYEGERSALLAWFIGHVRDHRAQGDRKNPPAVVDRVLSSKAPRPIPTSA
jgi:hypothetical protein